jgi:hypothetical protein
MNTNIREIPRRTIMKKYRLQTLLVAGLIALVAQRAGASDFSITIPVRLSNLPPNVQRLSIGCGVYEYRPGIARVIGQKSPPVLVEMSGGGYSGNVVVSINAAPGQDPANATDYQCSAYFIASDPAGTVGGVPIFYFQTAASPTFPLAAGAPFHLDTGRQPMPH